MRLFASGERTTALAQSLQAAVVGTNPKEKVLPGSGSRKKTNAVQVQPLSEFSGITPLPATYVFLVIGKELGGAWPTALETVLPSDIKDPKSTTSVLSSRLTSSQKNARAFTVVLFAPDAERFGRIYDEFAQLKFSQADQMQFGRSYPSNRVALFSTPENRDFAQRWGVLRAPNAWNDVRWYPLSERAQLTAEQLEERAQVYFADRSRQDALPDEAAQAIASQTLKPTTVLVQRAQCQTGWPLVVFSAPSRTLLETRAVRYPDLSVVRPGPSTEEAVDLRRIGRTVLLVDGSAPPEEREKVRLLLAKDMRSDLGLNLDERGSQFFATLTKEDALRQLMGETATRERVKAEARSRYVWVFTISDYGGATEYHTSETPLTPTPPAFSQSAPLEPSPRRSKGLFKGTEEKPADQYAREMNTWREATRQWESDRDNYNNRITNADYQWRCTVEANESGRVRGMLRLVDLDDKGHVEWEQECSANASNTRQFRSQTVAVRGPQGRPSSLEAPHAQSSCSATLMSDAARKAGQQGLTALRAQAWLPGPGETPPAEPEPQPTPVVFEPEPQPTALPVKTETGAAEATPPAKPLVAAVVGNLIVLTVGKPSGAQVGNRVEVAIKTKEVKNPTTGEVLETLVVESMRLRVTQVKEKTTSCEPADAGEARKLPQLQEGQEAQIFTDWPTPPAPASPAPARPTVLKPAPVKPAPAKPAPAKPAAPKAPPGGPKR